MCVGKSVVLGQGTRSVSRAPAAALADGLCVSPESRPLVKGEEAGGGGRRCGCTGGGGTRERKPGLGGGAETEPVTPLEEGKVPQPREHLLTQFCGAGTG